MPDPRDRHVINQERLEALALPHRLANDDVFTFDFVFEAIPATIEEETLNALRELGFGWRKARPSQLESEPAAIKAAGTNLRVNAEQLRKMLPMHRIEVVACVLELCGAALEDLGTALESGQEDVAPDAETARDLLVANLRMVYLSRREDGQVRTVMDELLEAHDKAIRRARLHAVRHGAHHHGLTPQEVFEEARRVQRTTGPDITAEIINYAAEVGIGALTRSVTQEEVEAIPEARWTALEKWAHAHFRAVHDGVNSLTPQEREAAKVIPQELIDLGVIHEDLLAEAKKVVPLESAKAEGDTGPPPSFTDAVVDDEE